MRRHRIAALVVSAVVITLAAVAAQSSLGHIRGIVKDRGGNVLPGVDVRILLLNGGVAERKTITDVKGEFSFLGMTPGRYTVKAVLSGFNPATAMADVRAGGTVKLALSLEVAGVTETVTVNAAPPPPSA